MGPHASTNVGRESERGGVWNSKLARRTGCLYSALPDDNCVDQLSLITIRAPAVSFRLAGLQASARSVFELEDLGPEDAVLAVLMEHCDLGSLARALHRRVYLPSERWPAHTTQVARIYVLRGLGGIAGTGCPYGVLLIREPTTHTNAVPPPNPSGRCCGRRRRWPREWPTSTRMASCTGTRREESVWGAAVGDFYLRHKRPSTRKK